MTRTGGRQAAVDQAPHAGPKQVGVLVFQGTRPVDLGAVLKRKIKPAFQKIGIVGVGWHTFRHTVGTMLAEMGAHQLTIRDYLRHGNLQVTNKYLQATVNSKRTAQEQLVGAILPVNGLRRVK